MRIAFGLGHPLRCIEKSILVVELKWVSGQFYPQNIPFYPMPLIVPFHTTAWSPTYASNSWCCTIKTVLNYLHSCRPRMLGKEPQFTKGTLPSSMAWKWKLPVPFSARWRDALMLCHSLSGTWFFLCVWCVHMYLPLPTRILVYSCWMVPSSTAVVLVMCALSGIGYVCIPFPDQLYSILHCRLPIR